MANPIIPASQLSDDPIVQMFINLVRQDAPDTMPLAHIVFCAEDLATMHATEQRYPLTIDCYREWLRRLGGSVNIPSYGRTMAAGRAQRERWCVSVWQAGATRPLSVTDFHGRNAQRDAEAYAARQREQIKQRGWTQRVSVGRVFEEA